MDSEQSGPKYGAFSRPLPEAEWPTTIPVTAR